MCDHNPDDISDLASFKLHFKQQLALRTDNEGEWKYTENEDSVHLFVLETDEHESAYNSEAGGERLPSVIRYGIVIDKELNVKIDSSDENVQVCLSNGAPLNSYSQLLTVMYILSESTAYDEEYLDEGGRLESEVFSQVDYIETEPEEMVEIDMLEASDGGIETLKNNFKCSFCSKVFNRAFRRREHENIHTGRKPYRCTVCSQAFSTSYLCNSHKELQHDKPRHTCQECGKQFHRKRNMQLHHRLIHLKEKPYACPICQRPYTDYLCFKRHIRRHTEGSVQTLRKNTVISMATSRSPKGKHPRNAALRPAKPVKPQASTATQSETRRKRNSLPKRHPCELCGVMFARRRNVEHHVKFTHTGIKPHECEFCGKKYSDITSFKRHIRAHTDAPDQNGAARESEMRRNDPATALRDMPETGPVASYIILDSDN